VRGWDVVGTSDGAEAVLASGVARVGQGHPSNTLMTCKSVGVASVEGPTFFVVRATYDMGEYVEFPEDPLNAPLDISWRPIRTPDAIDRDVDGNAITNSARDPYPPGVISRDYVHLGLVIVRNEPFFNIVKTLIFQNKVNNNPGYLGPIPIAAGECKCITIAPATSYKATARFIPIAYEFEFLGLAEEYPDNPFQIRIIDQGMRGWSDSSTVDELRNDSDEQVTTDVRLNGYGKPLDSVYTVGSALAMPVEIGSPAGATVESAPGNRAVFLRYTRYRSANFSLLGLA